MTAALRAGVAGIGLLGPGLPDWESGRRLLADPASWRPAPTVVTPPARLPAAERRRAGTLVKASMATAEQACQMAGIDPATLATVFTSSTGDPLNCHLLCETLATPERLVSPTRFTNSVHNAAAGYWHIAVRSRQPSTSLAAFDDSAAAGLLEAMAQCEATRRPVLLVACDLPYPEPLNALRPVADIFAMALLLVPPGHAAPAWLRLELGGQAPPTLCADARLERLRGSIPAARALPLLQALALGATSTLVLGGAGGQRLRLSVSPQL